MSRFRLLPTSAQELVLLEHCRQARFVWNLAVEQQQLWQLGRRAPGYHEQSAQLTEVRAEYDWLRAGSQTVQQQGPQGLRGGHAALFRRHTSSSIVAQGRCA
jgi:putative transposase